MIKKFWVLLSRHKIITVILLSILVFIGYRIYASFNSGIAETRYVLSAVTKGTVIASVSGSGQVSASNQLDLKPKASGTVISLPVKAGQEVKQGALVVQLDASDALKAVRDAQANLASAKLSLEKLQQPASALSITQAENTLARAQQTKQNSTDDLAKAYEDGFNDVSNAFLDLPDVMTGLHDLLFTNTPGLGSPGQWNSDFYADSVQSYDSKAITYKQETIDSYSAARTLYDASFIQYKNASRASDTAAIDSLITKTYQTTKSISDAIKNAYNLIQFYKDQMSAHGLRPAAPADTQLAMLNSYTGLINGHLSTLLNITNTITTDRDAITNADRTIDENTQSLADLKAGPDKLDIESSQLSIQQKQNALLDAQEKLADYYVRAPFDGTIAVLNVKKVDDVTSGTTIATLITKQKIAEITLNEVDVSKVAVGQKATLTFDAVEGLSITGVVASIDTIGTVSQGVVSYGVSIGFDTDDVRIKPGMSVSAAIVTDLKQDVLTVLNSALKTQGDQYYVETLVGMTVPTNAQGVASATPPVQKSVGVGLVSDTMTEITSGLNEGDLVITRTITATTQTTGTQAPSLFGAGGRGAGGGGLR